MSLEIGIDYLCGIATYADLRLAVGEVLQEIKLIMTKLLSAVKESVKESP